MSRMPPRQMPDDPELQEDHLTDDAPSGMLAMYNTASQANTESFPVLKAFQDYIEAERTQARKRVIQLSVFFSILMALVVAGFLFTGLFVLRNMSQVQTKLLDVALSTKEVPPITVTAPAPTPPPQPVIVQNSPQLEESMRLLADNTATLQANLDNKLAKITDEAQARVAERDQELQQLRKLVLKMEEQSTQLQTELKEIQTTAKEAQIAQIAQQPPAAPPIPPAQTTPDVPLFAQPAPPQKTVAAPPQPAPTKVATPTISYPPADKEPPTVAENVRLPPLPPGRMVTSLPLQTKNNGAINWRVVVPD